MALDIFETLFKITKAVTQFTDSKGTPKEEPVVSEYLNANGFPEDFTIISEVMGIAVGDFFAHSEQAFDNIVSDLWPDMVDAAGKAGLLPPSNLSIDLTLGQIAIYVAQVP